RLSFPLSLISSIGLIIIIGFFSGILFWIVSFPMVIHFAQSRVPQLYKIVGYTSTALLIAFSLWFLFSAIESFI
ncbi:MAG: LysE family translocator, partial [Nitrososphaerota archaeon]